MSDLAEKIRQKLTVDELVILEQTLDRLSRFIGLTKDGRVLIKLDRTKMSTRHLISLYAVGKYMAKQAGYLTEDIITIDEVTRELGVDGKVAAARIAELRREGVLLGVERGQYRFNPSHIERILAELEGYVSK
ncbi:MAG: hypothetical protein QXF84_05080 [Nitrososphaerota archaeon]